MDINLTFWLFIAMLITGSVVLLNIFIFKPRSLFRSIPWWLEMSLSFFPLIALVFTLRAFIFEPFQIPSGSMIPSLKVGDFILVNKFSYGVRLPFLGHTIIPINKPKRGEVMVFIPPGDTRNFIKRIVGLPGDVVEFKNNQLIINGNPVPQVATGEAIYNYGPGWTNVVILDSSIGDTKHKIQISKRIFNQSGVYGRYKVPKGHYFMVGDNRDGSADSRSCFGLRSCNQKPSKETPHPYGWTAVPENNIVGKPVYVWMHWDSFFSLPSFSENRAIQ